MKLDFYKLSDTMMKNTAPIFAWLIKHCWWLFSILIMSCILIRTNYYLQLPEDAMDLTHALFSAFKDTFFKLMPIFLLGGLFCFLLFALFGPGKTQDQSMPVGDSTNKLRDNSGNTALINSASLKSNNEAVAGAAANATASAASQSTVDQAVHVNNINNISINGVQVMSSNQTMDPVINVENISDTANSQDDYKQEPAEHEAKSEDKESQAPEPVRSEQKNGGHRIDAKSILNALDTSFMKTSHIPDETYAEGVVKVLGRVLLKYKKASKSEDAYSDKDILGIATLLYNPKYMDVQRRFFKFSDWAKILFKAMGLDVPGDLRKTEPSKEITRLFGFLTR